MKMIKTEDAIGHILCHDLTRIVRGEYKDAYFRKGHVVTQEDIPMLLSMGKERLYVWEMLPGMLHENDAAQRLLRLCQNERLCATEVKEGKIELTAQCDGLFRLDAERLNAVNSVGEIVIATRHNNTVARKGDKLAGMRVVPLAISEQKIEEAERIGGGRPLMELLPFSPMKAGVVTTGNEVLTGRIRDDFTPVVISKLEQYGIQTVWQAASGDEPDAIAEAIRAARRSGAELIVCTGGMSVDPDDNTPGAIKRSGAEIVTYGAPVLPGAMFLLGYFDDGVPVMGLPGCVMYSKATIFDLVLPRIAAGVRMRREDFAAMGNGGLCLGCDECRYPICPFGKFS